jgi:hypothetical protein
MAAFMGIAVIWISTIDQKLNAIVANNIVKMELAYAMDTALRERALSMHTIAAMDDPFDKDEYVQRFYDFGQQFITARERLGKMPLTTDETKLLSNISVLANAVQPRVQTAIDMAIAAETPADELAVLESIRVDAVPGQMTIARELGNLVQLQKVAAETATISADEAYRQALGV